MKVIGVNALVLFLLLAAVEAGLRLLGHGYGNATLNNDPFLHHVHPSGYSYLSYIPSNEYGGHEVFYNEKGFRADETAREKLPAAPLVWFVGDSFAEAAQVPWAATYPAKAVALLGGGLSAQNMGVPVYSPLLELLQMKKELAAGGPVPEMAFIQLFWDDLKNDDEYAPSTTFDANDEPVKCDGGRPDRKAPFLRKFYLARALRRAQITYQYHREMNRRARLAANDPSIPVENVELAPAIPDSSRFVKSIGQIDRFLSEKGIPHWFFAIPPKKACVSGDWAAPNFADNFNRFAVQKGLPFIDLNGAFQKASAAGERPFFEHDHHLNEKGHSLIAEEIAKAVNGAAVGSLLTAAKQGAAPSPSSKANKPPIQHQ